VENGEGGMRVIFGVFGKKTHQFGEVLVVLFDDFFVSIVGLRPYEKVQNRPFFFEPEMKGVEVFTAA
jgi:hypothetical protein